MAGNERLLLIDTCGETASVALTVGEELVAAEDLPKGGASAEILSAVCRLLAHSGWHLQDLRAIGVVRGPGSFTGIRAGLAVAKGLCESAGLSMAAVSRLEVLANAASLKHGFAALEAGRNEVYLRDQSTGGEWLCSITDLDAQCHGQQVAVAETRLADRLGTCVPVLHALHAADALRSVLRQLQDGGSDVGLTDANYVRQEEDIYRKPAGLPKPGQAEP